jgi:hypothetical protein
VTTSIRHESKSRKRIVQTFFLISDVIYCSYLKSKMSVVSVIEVDCATRLLNLLKAIYTPMNLGTSKSSDQIHLYLSLSNATNISLKLLDLCIKTLLSLLLKLLDIRLEIGLSPLISLSGFPLSRESSAYTEAVLKLNEGI